jgi:hypothetical protein
MARAGTGGRHLFTDLTSIVCWPKSKTKKKVEAKAGGARKQASEFEGLRRATMRGSLVRLRGERSNGDWTPAMIDSDCGRVPAVGFGDQSGMLPLSANFSLGKAHKPPRCVNNEPHRHERGYVEVSI